ncbi:MAG: DMT family transporter [Pseudomonadota bacterium]
MKFSLFQHPRGDRPVLALGLLLTGVFALALQDSLVKLMSDHTSFWQFQTLRSIGNVSFTLILATTAGGLGLVVPRNWRPVYLRAAFMIVCMFCFFAGAPFLTVAQMAAGLYTYPLFVSLLAGPVLGEKVGPWRIAALFIGAVGASFVLSPWQDDFSWIQVLPIVAGFFFALNILTIRRACRNESPLALTFAVGMVFLVGGLSGIVLLSMFPLSVEIQASMPFVAIGWPELTMLVAGFAVFASVLNLTGNICLSRAYQTADASLLAPLDFSYLLFAAIWSRLIFDQWPTHEAIIGMVLIATAGIITAWRESLATKEQKQSAA